MSCYRREISQIILSKIYSWTFSCCVCHVFAFVQCTINSSQKSSNAKLRLNIGELGAKWNKKFRNGTVFHFAPQFYLCSFVFFNNVCTVGDQIKDTSLLESPSLERMKTARVLVEYWFFENLIAFSSQKFTKRLPMPGFHSEMTFCDQLNPIGSPNGNITSYSLQESRVNFFLFL